MKDVELTRRVYYKMTFEKLPPEEMTLRGGKVNKLETSTSP
jgi:hypothetical protein